MMSSIRGGDTRPEIAVRSILHRAGFRFRIHDRTLPGTPDIVLRKWNAVIFVHGCFWHRHEGCRMAATPASNSAFWLEKFRANVARDARNRDALRSGGWRVLVIWECAVPHSGDAAFARLERGLSRWLQSGRRVGVIPAKRRNRAGQT
jgi:DNA mismatch endonuclease (patch repair protein)